ncbi:MAG: TetR/AcrR family transcriptional regulator [Lachnospiraceae bacterium]|nr:TetR/AcrR family transcriptional regulator [Lachnospiraceae bacterium]
MNERPKALAVYRAVIELMDEGADLNSMTVSEIAERAGIGKGTAYEYFSSKEDMVASAILYDINRLTGEVSRLIEKEATFEKKIYQIFDCMAQYPEGNRSFSNFIRVINHSFELGRPLCQEVERRQAEIQGPYQVLTELYDTAIQEGLAKGGLPRTMAILTLVSKFMMYLMYLEKREKATDVTEEEIRRFIYQGILADINLNW